MEICENLVLDVLKQCRRRIDVDSTWRAQWVILFIKLSRESVYLFSGVLNSKLHSNFKINEISMSYPHGLSMSFRR